MRILHITRYVDGFYQHLMDALAQCGAEQRILMPTTKNGGTWVERYHPLQPRSAIHTLLRRRFISLSNNDLYKAFADEIVEFKPNLIHAHTAIRGGSLALLLKERHGIEYVVSIRSTDIRRYLVKSRRHEKLFLNILQGARHVVFINPSLREDLYKWLPECQEKIANKTSFIGNGVEDFWLENIKLPRQGISKGVRLIQAGHISPRKNQLATFKAVELLNKNGIEARVCFVGREKEESYVSGLKNYISESQYGNMARFLPHQSKEELLELYRKSDIFIMPSIRETFGISYIEALSQGLPIIYSKGRGVDGVFERNAGYPANPDDPESIADAVRQVMENYQQLSENAPREAKRFDWKRIAGSLHDIYCIKMVDCGV